MTAATPASPDLLLAGIGLPLAVGGAVSLLTAVGPALAMVAGALPGALGMGYALFYAPPT